MKQICLSLVALLSLAIIGVGCGSSQPASSPTPSASDHPMMPHNVATMPGMAHGAVTAGMRIQLEDGQRLRSPGMNAFRFTVMGKDGKALTPDQLKIAHEKLIHLLVVRDDMTQFQHLHPVYESGAWAVTTTMAQPGDYNFYFDIAPKNEDVTVLRMSLRIATPTLATQFPIPNSKQQATDQDLTATLTTNGTWKVGEEKMLTFTLTKAGKRVATIDPYLGAFGHLVVLRHNAPEEFLHVHPVTEVAPKDGKVLFMTTFTNPGRYTLYAQFNIGGTVKTFPITVDLVNGVDERVSANGRVHHK